MIKPLYAAAACAVLVTTGAFAGETYTPTQTKDLSPPNPAIYGTGFYMGVQAGINAYVDYGDDRKYSVGGNDITISPTDQIGFVGGIKAGYVFGTGTVRPAIEADLYYNGVRGDLDVIVNGNKSAANADANLNSGAFMANFLLRFSFNRFQPYFGGGVGGYYAEADDIEVTVGGRNFRAPDSSNSGFAWQIIAGADYYFSETFSTFVEYKFLNYEDADLSSTGRLGQQLVVLGLRWHF